ncbi:hypothetical protein [Actinomadura sp. 6N118]|uniref:hypothetical protein n=1 Tax=Actinomadura sp. 6N118 TaxID=3375151 RepID=UPI0037A6E708
MTARKDPHPTATITVRTASAPDPQVLRGVIAARLAGRAVPDGPERAVADAVARHVAQAAGEAGRCR